LVNYIYGFIENIRVKLYWKCGKRESFFDHWIVRKWDIETHHKQYGIWN